MTNFTVRVELHDAESEDYKSLHEAMEKLGFKNTITDGKGNTFQLPTAEYNIETKELRKVILDSVKNAVKKTKRKGGVLVTQSGGRTWDGLPRVKKE